MADPAWRAAEEVRLEAGRYAAVVSSDGAALRRLTYGGRDLVVPSEPGRPIPDFRGVVAAPWPNRLEDGAYAWDGRRLEVPVNEPDRGSALHGLAIGRAWDVAERTPRSVRLGLDLEASPGYPFRLRLEAAYELGEDGLLWRVSARNLGDDAAPYGVCPHPYLVAGPAPLDEWELQIPADTFLEVTPDRLLPVGLRGVEGHEFDFREPRRLGATEIDHAFTDIRWDDGGRARLALRDPGGTGVAMEWDGACPWLQVHTADKKPPLPNRLGLAAEPMTCPPNALASGTDIVRLEPRAQHEAEWRIWALDS